MRTLICTVNLAGASKNAQIFILWLLAPPSPTQMLDAVSKEGTQSQLVDKNCVVCWRGEDVYELLLDNVTVWISSGHFRPSLHSEDISRAPGSENFQVQEQFSGHWLVTVLHVQAPGAALRVISNENEQQLMSTQSANTLTTYPRNIRHATE